MEGNAITHSAAKPNPESNQSPWRWDWGLTPAFCAVVLLFVTMFWEPGPFISAWLLWAFVFLVVLAVFLAPPQGIGPIVIAPALGSGLYALLTGSSAGNYDAIKIQFACMFLIVAAVILCRRWPAWSMLFVIPGLILITGKALSASGVAPSELSASQASNYFAIQLARCGGELLLWWYIATAATLVSFVVTQSRRLAQNFLPILLTGAALIVATICAITPARKTTDSEVFRLARGPGWEHFYDYGFRPPEDDVKDLAKILQGCKDKNVDLLWIEQMYGAMPRDLKPRLTRVQSTVADYGVPSIVGILEPKRYLQHVFFLNGDGEILAEMVRKEKDYQTQPGEPETVMIAGREVGLAWDTDLVGHELPTQSDLLLICSQSRVRPIQTVVWRAAVEGQPLVLGPGAFDGHARVASIDAGGRAVDYFFSWGQLQSRHQAYADMRASYDSPCEILDIRLH